MRRFLGGLGLLGLLLAWLLVGAGAAPSPPGMTVAFAPGEVLVQWRTGVPAAEVQTLLASEGAKRISTIKQIGVDRLRVPVGQEWKTIARLSADPRVAFAEPNYIAQAAGRPNDPEYWRQWNMEQIAAPGAWDVAKGDSNLIIAVIDSGADVNHPDLKGRLLNGWDYVRGDAIPDDEYGHGTHVAGVLGAVTNNGLGVAGTSWYGRLLLYKVLDKNGYGTYADIASAIVSAQGNGARIINLSLGGSTSSQTLLNAVNAAYEAGILLVGATGNDNGAVRYPAAYSQVVAVAATTNLDRHAWYSNYGPEVDVAAPGGLPESAIYSTIPGKSYGFLYGTSMSAAHVSGLATLVWSLAPTLSRDAVRQVIEATAEKVDSISHPYTGGRNNYLGYGRINAEIALRSTMSPQINASLTEILAIVAPNQPMMTRSVLLENPSLQPISWQAQVLAGSRWLSLTPPISGTLVYPATASLSLTMNAAGMSPGAYSGLVRITGSGGSGGQQVDIYVQLQVVSQLQRIFVPAILH